MADINVKSAQHYMNLWEEDIKLLNAKDWSVAYDGVTGAVNQDPRNPEFLILLGNLQEWKIYLVQDNEEKNYHLSNALQNYREAAALRPAWPFTWNHITLVKYRLGEIDDEFLMAMENAMETGPWEPGVQQVTVEVGLRTWKMLDFGLREKIVRNIYRGISLQPDQMMKILEKYNQLHLVCLEKNLKPAVLAYCGQAARNLNNMNHSARLKMSEQLSKP